MKIKAASGNDRGQETGKSDEWNKSMKYPWKNTVNQWGLVSIFNHWLMALAILANFFLGYWMVGLDYYDTWYHQGPEIHKSIGGVLMILMAFRLSWMLFSASAMPLPNHRNWEIILAKIVKWLLLISLFIILMSGYLMSTIEDQGIDVFHLFQIPATFKLFEENKDLLGDLHWYVALFMMGLVLLHAMAALKHHLIDKDRTFLRILWPNLMTQTEKK